ncbi:MAG TPA: hypothetical protein VGK74_22550 [Symbiobacteriaceae bacterium]|jgi:hypothetical protein
MVKNGTEVARVDNTILRDVELRLQALEDARRLEPMVAGCLAQLQEAKARATQAEVGGIWEQKYLKEAAEAGERLSVLREQLYRAERELRRTSYLLALLRGDGE